MSQVRDERLAKIQQLREMGVEPYPYRFDRSHHAQDIVDRYDELEEQEVVVAGRIMTRRKHGKTAFIDLRDESGKIQLYLRKDILGEEGFDIFKQTDIGDFLGVRGKIFKTRTEETTIRVEEIEILSKAVNVFPDKFHGVSDTELRYRQRYLDLIMNPEVRETFLTRRSVIDIVREVFNGKGGVEVETPTLQPIYGGASARPFTTHHNKLDTTLYLRIANELYLKRLIVGGFECVYEICKDFRNEGMDKTHNPEFTMVEIYWAYKDYNDMMTLVEELFLALSERIKGTTTVEYQGVELNFAPPWPRRPMLDLIKEYADVDVAALDDEGLRAALGKLYEESVEDADELAKCRRELPSLNRGNMIDELFGLKVEDHLIQPTFVTDFPKEISPLAKQHRDDPTLTERFELFIAGREIANAFSELNDPIDQRARFEAQMRFLDDGDAEAQPLDEDYLRAMEYGMPPMGGLGIGIDRVAMLFTDQSTIQEVILFPQMRPEKWISKWHQEQAEKKAAKAEKAAKAK